MLHGKTNTDTDIVLSCIIANGSCSTCIRGIKRPHLALFKLLIEGGRYAGKIWDEHLVYKSKAEERFQLGYVMLLFQNANCIGRMASTFQFAHTYYMPKIMDLLAEEIELLRTYRNARFW